MPDLLNEWRDRETGIRAPVCPDVYYIGGGECPKTRSVMRIIAHYALALIPKWTKECITMRPNALRENKIIPTRKVVAPHFRGALGASYFGDTKNDYIKS